MGKEGFSNKNKKNPNHFFFYCLLFKWVRPLPHSKKGVQILAFLHEFYKFYTGFFIQVVKFPPKSPKTCVIRWSLNCLSMDWQPPEDPYSTDWV